MAKGIMIVAEQREGALRKISLELASTARKLADAGGDEVSAILLGSGVESLAAELGKYGVDKVFVGEDAALEPYVTEAHAEVTAKIIKENDPAAVLFGASVQGKDLSARVAAKLATGLATDCTDVKIDGGKLTCTRPMYAGKCFGEVEISASPQMASLRPNVFPAVENAKAGAVTKVDVKVEAQKSKVLEVQKDTSGKVDLTEANAIVSGGRGLKGPEGFAILEELAAVLGGTVGASRAAVDAGWREQKDQVGQTGKVVSPNLYVACGISGAIQHLAGMSSSKYIVAINKDEEAPIFAKADYGVVDDLFKVVPALTGACKKLIG
ncbi:MAG TPA: electron transfer flavoprotein subunit alpha/FixB family protein [Deltaproteobacteria bacterium]|nr:electron transfer flavoprotein subunit alpha/FixB family protein [Deltaproteobacteria bacterium]